MKQYYLIEDTATREYLNSLATLDCHYIKSDESIEDGAILFIHFQSSKKNIESILTKFSNAKIALLSDNPSFDEGYRYLRFHIKAYANTYMAEMHYRQLIGMLENSNNWFYPEFTNRLLSCAVNHQHDQEEMPPEVKKLSAKEQEVALLVSKSLKNVQIAQALNIKERTVKQHLSNIYKKLDIHDRVSLAMLFS